MRVHLKQKKLRNQPIDECQIKGREKGKLLYLEDPVDGVLAGSEVEGTMVGKGHVVGLHEEDVGDGELIGRRRPP